ncbi:GNAT family N-acetyltransferase [Levilactobacillus tujiorum]|uniref:GNAT family N-acetyltransferase n=1 Tax=Levilactobacillus tujiorum TaxID=2912243 RepID=UPI0014579590|nr:GNAT family N-acetyltransferase [Levilactobacillus tujiorum]NLR32694.1 GNAT family N-acetyltransferase [Levilactobacillus tujiorum]
MQIRQAHPQDSAQIAPLIAMIYRDMEMPVLQNVSESALLSMLTELYAMPENLNGIAQTWVADDDGRVLGVAFGHPAENEIAVNQILKQVSGEHPGFSAPLELGGESRPGEWYLSMLAVAPQAQGQGIGSQLLKALPRLVEKFGQSKISLNVDDGNPGAAKLYRRQGFKPDGRLMIGVHPYQHMGLIV